MNLPTITELREAYEKAYGEMGVYYMAGALYANVTDMKIKDLYQEALEKALERISE